MNLQLTSVKMALQYRCRIVTAVQTLPNNCQLLWMFNSALTNLIQALFIWPVLLVDDCVQGEHLQGSLLVSWWVMADAAITQSGLRQPSAGGTPHSPFIFISVMNLSSGALRWCRAGTPCRLCFITCMPSRLYYNLYCFYLTLILVSYTSITFLFFHFLLFVFLYCIFFYSFTSQKNTAVVEQNGALKTVKFTFKITAQMQRVFASKMMQR